MSKDDLISVTFPGSGAKHTASTYWFKPLHEAIVIGVGIFLTIFVTSYFVYHEARKALIDEIGRGLVGVANAIAAQIDVDDYSRYQRPEDVDDKYRQIETLFRQIIDRTTQGDTDPPHMSEGELQKLALCGDYLSALSKATDNPRENDQKACVALRNAIASKQTISYVYTFRLVPAGSDRCKTKSDYQLEFVFDAGQDLEDSAYSPQEQALNYVKYHEKSAVGECYGEAESRNEELDAAFRVYSGTSRAWRSQIGYAETKLRQDENFGLLLSGYAPLYNSREEFVGLLGVDINAAEFETRIGPLKSAIVRTIAAGFFIAFLIAAQVWFLRNFASVINQKRLALLADAKRHFSANQEKP